MALQWRHNEPDCVSNHRPYGCLRNLYVQLQMKEDILALRHWFVWENSPVTGEFPTQRASNAENVPFDDVIMEFHRYPVFVNQCVPHFRKFCRW